MSRRMWAWATVLVLAGGLMLAASIRGFVSWRPPPQSVAVLTLDQLSGFIVAAVLLSVAVLVLLTGFRRGRRRRKLRLLEDKLRPVRAVNVRTIRPGRGHVSTVHDRDQQTE
jgi:hypothetical protein